MLPKKKKEAFLSVSVHYVSLLLANGKIIGYVLRERSFTVNQFLSIKVSLSSRRAKAGPAAHKLAKPALLGLFSVITVACKDQERDKALGGFFSLRFIFRIHSSSRLRELEKKISIGHLARI